MKKFTLAALAAVGLFQMDANAQCTVTAPLITDGYYPTAIGHGITTPDPSAYITQAASANLPNVEYIVTLYGTKALQADGVTLSNNNVIIGTDVDGIFHPSLMSRYGVMIGDGDTFEITPVGYDLASVKILADALLNNNISPGNPCCNIFGLIPEAAGFCTNVNAAGIFGASDVNDLGDVLDVFDAMSDAQMSIESLDTIMGQVNGYASLIPPNCGQAELPLCYGFSTTARYRYAATTPVPVTTLSSTAAFAVFPNPATQGTVNVMIQTVENSEISLSVYNLLGERLSNQQIQVNGDFTATISTSELSAGMYVVEINDGKNKMSKKLVVR